MSLMKELAFSGLVRAGYRVVRMGDDRVVQKIGTHYARRYRTYCEYGFEQHLSFLLGALKINCVLDVGANEGQYGAYLRSIGYEGHIVSFEPLSEAYAKLRECAARDPGWTAHNLGLGASDTQVALNVAEGSVCSSILRPVDNAESIVGRAIRPARTEIIALRRLDGVIEDVTKHIMDPVILLKVDTQGYELEVLEGLETLNQNIAAIQSELSVVPSYHGAPHYTQALEAFERRGFALSGLFPMVIDKEGRRVIEIDCLLVASQRESPPEDPK